MKSGKSIIFILALSLIFMTILPQSSQADPLDNWIAVTSGTDNWLYGIAYGNNKFVAVGLFSTITSLTSPDGVVWTSNTSGSGVDVYHLNGIAFGNPFGNGIFVAVGVSGTILTSSDNGVSWIKRTSGTRHFLYGITYGDSIFVAVGESDTILTSPDGINWTERFSGSFYELDGVTYGDSTFVAVGESGRIFTSTNGENWYLEDSGTDMCLTGVAYGNGTFVAVGQSGTIATSDHGINWTVGALELTGWLHAITFENGTFVAVGESGRIFTSPDGVSWTERTSGTIYTLEAVTHGSGKFAVVGGLGTILLDYDETPLDPVRIWRAHYIDYYKKIQDAYYWAWDGNIIEIQALQFNENLIFDTNKTVILRGGFNSTYSTNPSSTTINGSITISDGTVVVENIVIM